MATLTVIILTKNEAANIKAVVQNCLQVTDDVLVLDSGSTDATVELAKTAGARIAYRVWDNDFSAQRNFALEQTDADWVLYVDADERLTPPLVEAVREALLKDADYSYRIKRKSVAFGQEFNYGVLHPDFVGRMFKRNHVRWVNKVHEHPECEDPELLLKGYLRHYPYPSWQHYFTKFNQYTSIWAENAYEKEKRTSIMAAYFHALGGFLHMALVKKGILDGGLGVALCCNHFTYTLMKYLKLLELQKQGKED